jgi:hypothetical protein
VKRRRKERGREIVASKMGVGKSVHGGLRTERVEKNFKEQIFGERGENIIIIYTI